MAGTSAEGPSATTLAQAGRGEKRRQWSAAGVGDKAAGPPPPFSVRGSATGSSGVAAGAPSSTRGRAGGPSDRHGLTDRRGPGSVVRSGTRGEFGDLVPIRPGVGKRAVCLLGHRLDLYDNLVPYIHRYELHGTLCEVCRARGVRSVFAAPR